MDPAFESASSTPCSVGSAGLLYLWEDGVISVASEASLDARTHELASRGLTAAEKTILDRLWEVSPVDAVYCDRDREGLLMVFVVVREHDDDAYEQVLRAEEGIARECPEPIELRIRAHQGRNPRRAVPIGTLPLLLRD